jgi:beta-galactosidase
LRDEEDQAIVLRLSCFPQGKTIMSTFGISGDSFAYNGQPIRILSGAIHYFRVRPEYWRDRLLKLKACGLNTVETYVAWNLHEPRRGEFHFEDGLDIARFIRLAGELGLFVIVRPGPYICSEWDLGGLPAWLLADAAMQLRCVHRPYLMAVDRFLDLLISHLGPLQCTEGGPLIAMQVENEYGSYGNDCDYLRHIVRTLRGRGIELLLFTSDGGTDAMLQGGTLPDVHKTVNFGSRPAGEFARLREYQPAGPLMCTEFWNGWFDHWGEPHHTRPVPEVAGVLDEMLAMGASVNFYMFHGGTNFGFMNGANYSDHYEPTVTSYDDDAPLDEAGDITPKYLAFREVIGKYVALPDMPLPAPSPKLALGPVRLTEQVSLLDSLSALSAPVKRTLPEPMEPLGQAHGFILYRTHVTGPRPPVALTIQDVHDRAQVFLDGKLQGVLERAEPPASLQIEVPPGGAQLDILVENMGRINYGPHLLDRKGITQGVRLGNQFLYHWTIFPLPLDDLSRLTFGSLGAQTGPAFYRGTFAVAAPADTFLALPGWTKGVCWINGFNLGRYWERGPQHTLYVPAPLLRAGVNELVVLELHGMREPVVEFRDRPTLG